MLQLLENDIEIIEVTETWRQQAGNKMPVVWLNDGHTGPTGRKIFAQALVERLQRYDFARQRKAAPARFEYKTKEQTGAKMTTLKYNNAWMSESLWARKKKSPFPYDDPQAANTGIKNKKKKTIKASSHQPTAQAQRGERSQRSHF